MKRQKNPETSKVGKRGAIVIPSRLRKRFGIEEGSLIVIEERADGILIRPAIPVPIETYTPERIAEFILNNAVGRDEYLRALDEVRAMGIDPSAIPHEKQE